MAEKDVPLLPVKVIYICDACKKGEMVRMNITTLCSPMRYEHKCNNSKCDKTKMLDSQYPKIEYRDFIADVSNKLGKIDCSICPVKK